MQTTAIQQKKQSLPSILEKMQKMEQEFQLLKLQLFKILPATQKNRIRKKTDTQIWQDIQKDYEKIQAQLFQERYPELYAKIRK